MMVSTSSVVGRRQLRFDSYHDLLKEAEGLVCGEALMLGNWSLGQILSHLARTMHASIDGLPYQVPSWRRFGARLFYRQQLLSGPMRAGMKLPEQASEALSPLPVSDVEGLAELRHAVDRLSFEMERATHPLLGELSLDEWDQFHLRHAELHLSFALPLEVPALVEAE